MDKQTRAKILDRTYSLPKDQLDALIMLDSARQDILDLLSALEETDDHERRIIDLQMKLTPLEQQFDDWARQNRAAHRKVKRIQSFINAWKENWHPEEMEDDTAGDMYMRLSFINKAILALESELNAE